MTGRRKANRPLPVLRVVAVLGALSVAALVLWNSRDELLTSADQITGVEGGWVVLAGVGEVLSYTFYAAGQQVLLRAGEGPGVGLPTLTTTAVVAQAAANCLPGGLAITTLVSFRQLTRRGVLPALAGYVLALGAGTYMAALALLSLVAAQVTGDQGPVPGLREVSLGVVVTVLTVGAVGVLLRRRVDVVAAETKMRAWLWAVRRRLPGQRTGQPGRSWALQLRPVRERPMALLHCLALMLASWLADVAVLAAAYRALDLTPPWRGLLLAYCAGQLAASVPVTPGGLGVVEGSLTLALVAFGGAEQSTLSAVLLYRLVSFWALLPAGAAGWFALSRRPARRPANASAPVPEPEPAS